MNLAQITTELARLGVVLEAAGGRLRFRPKAVITPELLAAMAEHKADLFALAELLGERAAILQYDGGLERGGAERRAWELTSGEPVAGIVSDSLLPASLCKKPCWCGSTKTVDVLLEHEPHNGTTVRRDCRQCGRFVSFPVWYGAIAGCRPRTWISSAGT